MIKSTKKLAKLIPIMLPPDLQTAPQPLAQ
jgi:hypothetical protein